MADAALALGEKCDGLMDVNIRNTRYSPLLMPQNRCCLEVGGIGRRHARTGAAMPSPNPQTTISMWGGQNLPKPVIVANHLADGRFRCENRSVVMDLVLEYGYRRLRGGGGGEKKGVGGGGGGGGNKSTRHRQAG